MMETIQDYDVLCARGRSVSAHIGNRRFREIIGSHVPHYRDAKTKEEKTAISSSIVKLIRSQSPGGRFLKEDPETGQYHDIGDEKAREKVSQSLREGVNPKPKRPPAPPRKKRIPEKKPPRLKPCFEEPVVIMLVNAQRRIYTQMVRDTNLDDGFAEEFKLTTPDSTGGRDWHSNSIGVGDHHDFRLLKKHKICEPDVTFSCADPI